MDPSSWLLPEAGTAWIRAAGCSRSGARADRLAARMRTLGIDPNGEG
jgi:hypothetical protein